MMSKNNQLILSLGILLALIIGGSAYAYFSLAPAMEENGYSFETVRAPHDPMVDDMGIDATGSMMDSVGSYEAYTPEKLAKAEDGSVVIFFRAPWCSTCTGLDADIQAHLNEIPEKTHILVANYDSETALKKKYGVTYQHTLVQVDQSGKLIKKWQGSPTLATLISEIQS